MPQEISTAPINTPNPPTENKSSKSLLKKILIVFLIIIIAIVAYISSRITFVLNLDVSPNDAQITIDGHPYKEGSIYLTPGEHQLRVAKNDFQSYKETIIAEKWKRKKVVVNLKALQPTQKITSITDRHRASSWGSNETLISISKTDNTLVVTDLNGKVVKRIPAPNKETLSDIISTANETIIKTGSFIDEYRHYYILKDNQFIPLVRTNQLSPSDISIHGRQFAFISNINPNFQPYLYASSLDNDSPARISSSFIPISKPIWINDELILLFDRLDAEERHVNLIQVINIKSGDIFNTDFLSEAENLSFLNNKVAYIKKGTIIINDIQTSESFFQVLQIQETSPIIWLNAETILAIQSQSENANRFLVLIDTKTLTIINTISIPTNKNITSIEVSPDQLQAILTNSANEVFLADLPN